MIVTVYNTSLKCVDTSIYNLLGLFRTTANRSSTATYVSVCIGINAMRPTDVLMLHDASMNLTLFYTWLA